MFRPMYKWYNANLLEYSFKTRKEEERVAMDLSCIQKCFSIEANWV